MNTLVSIIIPTLDREARLLRALRKIEENTDYKPYEIIIVVEKGIQDYAFLDGIKDIFPFEETTIIRNKEKKELWQNYKQGIDMSKGEYIAWLSDDIEVCPRWLTLAMDEMKKLNEYGYVGLWDGLRGAEDQSVHGVITKKLWLEYWTDDYIHYGFDVELSLRAKRDGRYIKSKKAMALHYHEEMKKELKDDIYIESMKNRKRDDEMLNKRLSELGLKWK